MRKITFILFYLLLIVVISARAQTGKRNSIGISLGWQQMKFNDELASPLLYKATSFPTVGLNYTHSSLNQYFKVKLSGGTGNANPEKFGARNYMAKWSDKDSFQYQISSMFVHANLEATYLRRLNPSSSGNLGYWLGGTLTDHAYYADEVANFPWLMNAAELGPAFKVDYQDNSRHSFTVRVDLTAIAMLTRSVYALFPKSNKENNVKAFIKQGTRITSAHQYQKVNVEMNYSYHMSNRVAVGGTYGFKWMHYNYPKSLRAVDSRFNVNVDYNLNKNRF